MPEHAAEDSADPLLTPAVDPKPLVAALVEKYENPNKVVDPFDEALAHIAGLIAAGGVVGLHQGRMEFGPRALGHRSILGDARSNNTDPRSDIMKEISERSKRVLWLNPEPPPLWGTGDSEVYRYRPYCNLMREVNTLQHLERIVNDLVRVVKAAS